ncbi:hypothetical protein P43SY_008152 [Pythium insidiosum]|uniref:Uncharacterized protein n=1 Tax=Pythium insidiosum TaxID=114742 RepID=A0AAD5M009_PYTIN|nr:hypothetical protein P43SY_008152 [Pythium insidiosum]
MAERATNAAALALGVKGKLSNQEMELLKQKLAEASAYDHVPQQRRDERRQRAAAASKPMTRVYRKVPDDGERPEQQQHQQQQRRPSRKTLASIEYERQFSAYDSLQMRPAPRGISAAARTALQDAYVTQPREISCVPQRLLSDEHSARAKREEAAALKPGKRLAPPAIPQLFII